ncbi:MAG: hypothetical protein ACK5Q5_04630, partial [Planctomycetaceae bacterium]
QIDVARLEMSPLLTAPKRTDGLHDLAFRGPKAEDQYQRLAAWVRLAAQETGRNTTIAQQPAPAPATIPPTILPTAAYLPAPGLPSTTDNPGDATPLPSTAAQASAPAEVNDAFLRHILDENRPDPFDPDIFNRRVHGRPAGRVGVGSP